MVSFVFAFWPFGLDLYGIVTTDDVSLDRIKGQLKGVVWENMMAVIIKKSG